MTNHATFARPSDALEAAASLAQDHHRAAREAAWQALKARVRAVITAARCVAWARLCVDAVAEVAPGGRVEAVEEALRSLDDASYALAEAAHKINVDDTDNPLVSRYCEARGDWHAAGATLRDLTGAEKGVVAA